MRHFESCPEPSSRRLQLSTAIGPQQRHPYLPVSRCIYVDVRTCTLLLHMISDIDGCFCSFANDVILDFTLILLLVHIFYTFMVCLLVDLTPSSKSSRGKNL